MHSVKPLKLQQSVKEANSFEGFGCAVRVHVAVHGLYSSGQQPYITNEPLAHHLPAAALFICQQNVLILQIS